MDPNAFRIDANTKICEKSQVALRAEKQYSSPPSTNYSCSFPTQSLLMYYGAKHAPSGPYHVTTKAGGIQIVLKSESLS